MAARVLETLGATNDKIKTQVCQKLGYASALMLSSHCHAATDTDPTSRLGDGPAERGNMLDMEVSCWFALSCSSVWPHEIHKPSTLASLWPNPVSWG